MTVSSRLVVPAMFWVGLIGAVIALWLSGQGENAWGQVREARVAPLVLVVLLGMALPVIHALRWRVVMRALDTDVPAIVAADVTVSSSLVNYASPGYLGAPAKAFLANRTADAPYGRTILSMAFEQGLDFLMLLAGSVVALALLGPSRLGDLVPEINRTEQVLIGVGAVVALVALAIAGRARVQRVVARIVDAFRTLGSRVEWPTVAVLTLTYWLAQVAVVALLLWALALPVTLTAVLSLATIPLLIGQAVPLPGGVGAREAAIVALSAATGASAVGLLGLAVLQRVLLVAALPLSLGALRVARLGGAGR
jgi:uncharacterized membrane protein YbhN (UPF0104 family)